ncbi:cell division protein ZapA [Rhodocytophaga rosea]|uniref:Cell division protein ZapA n=1 Tax=Rhodocytophaga rosea TaxID=2704465 RepID=A0A6C0GF58_9BACT|nr:cell division protein ZapA [Rhodocytophaga rosea]QHT66659.1 cell division protein ZapA [Rhodocytophaga rosea]
MSSLSLKIKIADREYPIKAPAAEEERLRNAGKAINDKLRLYKTQFGIDDKQDLLAMVAIECMVEKIRSEEETSGFTSAVSDKIERLDNLITSAL